MPDQDEPQDATAPDEGAAVQVQGAASRLFSQSVTVFPNARSPKERTTETLSEVLAAIQSGQFKEKIDELRRIRTRDGKATYDKAKTELPAFCVSGITANRKTITSHTGLIQLDFDALGAAALPTARQRLQSDPYIAAMFLSPSGDGLKAFLRADGAFHAQTWEAAVQHFRDHYKLTVDAAVKEPARLCFVSYDPDLYRNEEALIFPVHTEKEQPKRGRPSKEKAWWSAYKGDLATLKIAPMFQALGLYGQEVDPDTGKHSVKCPWHKEHADGGENWTPRSTETTLFLSPGQHPAFKCLHAHCAERKLQQVLEWFEAVEPGCVDKMCAEQRVWQPGQKTEDGRPRIINPGIGRPDDEFATEIADIVAPKHTWFAKDDAVVHVVERKLTEKVTTLVFASLDPIEVRTALAFHVQTGLAHTEKESGQLRFVPTTISREAAAGLVAAPQFFRRLPRITRILDLPLPVLVDGEITHPKLHFDPRFGSYTNPHSPPIGYLPLEEARNWLFRVHEGFAFKDDQAVVHAIARLITPFCRGIMGWDARFPCWHYSANRPRSGKDYLAGVAQIVYEGRTQEDAPLGNDSEETRKRITAALCAGRRMMHFANCQGHLKDATFIGAVTSKTFGVRSLGATDAKSDLLLPNELEFSLSANIGLTFRPDVEPRTRRISLSFSEENANGRIFPNPQLHDFIWHNRRHILSAINTLVEDWVKAGCKSGNPFNSFPEWGRVVGGIMLHHGLGDPCALHADDGGLPADKLTDGMAALFLMCYEAHPETWIDKSHIYAVMEANAGNEALDFFGDLTDRSMKTRFGLSLRQFASREFHGISMENDGNERTIRQRIRFTRHKAPQADLLAAFFGKTPNVSNVSTPKKPQSQDLVEPTPSRKVDTLDTLDTLPRPTRIEKLNAVVDSEDHVIKMPPYTGPTDVSRVSKVSTEAPDPAVRPSTFVFSLITTPTQLEVVAATIESSGGEVALDIETFGDRGDSFDPWRGEIRLVSLATPTGDVFLVDVKVLRDHAGVLFDALRGASLVIHNARFDCLWLLHKFGFTPSSVFCTLTAERILNAGTTPGNDLDSALSRRLGVPHGTEQGASDWGGMFLTDDQLAYAARDVQHLIELAAVQRASLELAGLSETAELEMALLGPVVAMEHAGMPVEVEAFKAVQEAASAQARALSDEILAVFGFNFNLGSPDQLLAALARHELHLGSTNEATLIENRHALINGVAVMPKILDLRSATKLASQATSLIKAAQADGRIHGRFDPMGTATGRFTAKEPNLQNVARGPLRGCFRPPEGRVFVVADYSQVELRAAAAIAGETKMIKAFAEGQDLHAVTAAVILDKPLAEVTKHDRQVAKSANFGLIYGQSAPGLVEYAKAAFGVELTLDAADTIRKAFFRTYDRLRQWHGTSHGKAKAGVREVRTVIGRRRIIPEQASEWERFTALVNTPVQGGCADGMKRAIVRLHSLLPRGTSIVSTVHDELIVECDEEHGSTVRDFVRKVMTEATQALFPAVPIEVDANVCKSWGDK